MGNVFEFMGNFLNETALDKVGETALLRKELKPPLEIPPNREYPIIELPTPESLKDTEDSFLKMIELRQTIREYENEPITLEELSYLLWATQGVKGVARGITFRNVPSARASHAFETYLLVNNVTGLPSGVYRFLAIGHSLQGIEVNEEALDTYIDCFLPKNMVKKSGVTFIWTADFQRMAYSCGVRSARYIFLDAGHVCQNLYLAAESRAIGVCAIGHFDDAKLNAKLGLDGKSAFTVYCATAGKVG